MKMNSGKISTIARSLLVPLAFASISALTLGCADELQMEPEPSGGALESLATDLERMAQAIHFEADDRAVPYSAAVCYRVSDCIYCEEKTPGSRRGCVTVCFGFSCDDTSHGGDCYEDCYSSAEE